MKNALMRRRGAHAWALPFLVVLVLSHPRPSCAPPAPLAAPVSPADTIEPATSSSNTTPAVNPDAAAVVALLLQATAAQAEAAKAEEARVAVEAVEQHRIEGGRLTAAVVEQEGDVQAARDEETAAVRAAEKEAEKEADVVMCAYS